ncbi:LysE family translocator [Aestuariivirga sp.]|uniref:LysE family translocator n=1 Tax=Aestuariivirga sp. TaxID=2650926 RepID=UPI00391DC8AE
MDFALLATGIAIGLSVTAPLGPVNILVIRSAIRRGFAVALLTGLGAVGADCFYAVVAAYGVSSVAHAITDYARPLMVAGGILLVAIGVRLARSHIGLAELDLQAPPRRLQIAGRMLTAFMLTLTNPGVLFGFIAIFGTMNAVLRLDEGAGRPVTVVAGVAIGGALWWLFLSYVVARFKTRIDEKMFDRINRWTGILIAAFGFALLMEAVA